MKIIIFYSFYEISTTGTIIHTLIFNRMSKRKDDPPKIHLPKEQGLTVQFARSSSDMVSYEDLLIAQYLEELRKTKGEMRKKKE